MSENFAEAPVAIDELRARRSEAASDISPRSVLVELLRRIDKGEVDPDWLMVTYRYAEHDVPQVAWSVSSPSMTMTLGMIEWAKLRIWQFSYPS